MSVETPYYTVGARLDGCVANPRLHITLSYLGVLDADALRERVEAINAIVTQTQREPLLFGQGVDVMFGKDGDLPAHHVHMLGGKDTKEGTRAFLWREFNNKFGRPAPGMAERFHPMNYHITMKEEPVRTWVHEQVARTPFGSFLSTKVFLKPIGGNIVREWLLREDRDVIRSP